MRPRWRGARLIRMITYALMAVPVGIIVYCWVKFAR